MYPSGLFVVSRAHVRSRPRSYYEQLRNQLDAPSPIECHYLERSWYYVFGMDSAKARPRRRPARAPVVVAAEQSKEGFNIDDLV